MIALDTNILAYAEQRDDPQGRNIQAVALLEQFSTGEHCIPVQVLAEFANACGKKQLLDRDSVARKIDLYTEIFETPHTLPNDLIVAAHLLDRFNLQYFDTLILTVARRAGAVILLSEDMHDGLEVEGIRIVNPFNAGNDPLIANALT